MKNLNIETLKLMRQWGYQINPDHVKFHLIPKEDTETNRINLRDQVQIFVTKKTGHEYNWPEENKNFKSYADWNYLYKRWDVFTGEKISLDDWNAFAKEVNADMWLNSEWEWKPNEMYQTIPSLIALEGEKRFFFREAIKSHSQQKDGWYGGETYATFKNVKGAHFEMLYSGDQGVDKNKPTYHNGMFKVEKNKKDQFVMEITKHFIFKCLETENIDFFEFATGGKFPPEFM